MKTCLMYGEFSDGLRQDLVEAVHKGWLDAGATWVNNNTAMQRAIAERIKAVPWARTSAVDMDVPLSKLGVGGSQAQIDIVVNDEPGSELGAFLIHVSGHKAPRHEKELLEFLAVSQVAPKCSLAMMVASSNNKLRLEGKRTSCDYLCGALANLARPVLAKSNLKGVLVICLP